MGQGGYLSITNSTPYCWKKTYDYSYQMDAWNFPDVIEKGINYKLYIEWDESIFHQSRDDQGIAEYTIEDGSGSKLKINANNRNEFCISINSSGLKRKKESRKREDCVLGWMHDGIMNYVVVGDKDGYMVTGDDFSGWMEDTLDLIGKRRLFDICMPGSHDSGMSVCQNATLGASAHNTVTQTCDITGQLELGARYFDLRPTISGGGFYTGHYGHVSKVGVEVDVGGNGQKLDEIVEQINVFTRSHRELIILNISHSLNTDVGQGVYRSFSDEEWKKCLGVLEKLNYRYEKKHSGDLSLKHLEDYLDAEIKVLVIVEDLSSIPSRFVGKGFFPYSQYNVYNSYSKTNKLAEMMSDQLEKMRINSKQKLFLLSWTLTQEDYQAAYCGDSILKLAEKANENLDCNLYPKVLSYNYPNIIYTDKIENCQTAVLSCAINWGLFH